MTSHFGAVVRLGSVACALALAACGGGSKQHVDESVPVVLGQSGPGDTGGYFPMQVGNTWSFTATLTENGYPQTARSVIRSTETRPTDGATGTVFVETNTAAGSAESVLVSDPGGIAEYGSRNIAGMPGWLGAYWIVRFPLTPGSSFVQLDKVGIDSGEDLDGDGRNETVDVRSVVTVLPSETVHVPAGTFSGCAKVKTEMDLTVFATSVRQSLTAHLVQTSWYAPGIGWVRVTMDGTIPGQAAYTEVYDLIGYSVNGATGGDQSDMNPVQPPGTPAILVLPANDLVSDAQRGVLYASVASRAGANGNSVAIVDPATTRVDSYVFVGSEPSKLALSDDGRYLYVALDGPGQVKRLDLAASGGPAVDASFTITLPSVDFFGPTFADDIAVAPGAPHTIAVARRYQGVSPRYAGVVVYDDAVQRPTTSLAPYPIANVIAFGPTASRLYGYDSETTGYRFQRFTVTGAGVAADGDGLQGLVSGFDANFVLAGGVAYGSNGVVFDPETGNRLGTFALSSSTGYGGTALTVDAASARAFFVSGTVMGYSVEAFDTARFTPVGSATVTVDSSASYDRPKDVVRYGPRGLAFRIANDRIAFTSAPPGSL